MSIIKIHNAETGEVVEREMNEEELAQQALDSAAYKAKESEAAAKEAQRQTLLAKLGITEEEAKLLLS